MVQLVEPINPIKSSFLNIGGNIFEVVGIQMQLNFSFFFLKGLQLEFDTQINGLQGSGHETLIWTFFFHIAKENVNEIFL